MGYRSDTYRVLVSRPSGRRPIGRPRHDINIRIILILICKKWDGEK
jgi:hypothetical protein